MFLDPFDRGSLEEGETDFRLEILGRVPGLDHDAVAVDIGVERLIEALKNDPTKGWVVELVELFDVKK